VHRPEVELVDDRNLGGPQQVQEEADWDVSIRPSAGGIKPVKNLDG
jgi:hypothetical protein